MKNVRVIWKRKAIIFIEDFIICYIIITTVLEHFGCISHLLLTTRMRDVIPIV